MIAEFNEAHRGYVEIEAFGPVLEIRMTKPKVNAICRRLSRALGAALDLLQDDDGFRVGILASASNRAFSAGWDFNEAIARDGAGDPPAGGFGGITANWRLDKPVVAAINAPAVGGGFEIALACDVLVMADEAYFELPEMQRGILPDAGGLQRLPWRLPYNVATAMVYTGRRMPAAEAKGWGLVHSTCPAAELAGQARETAAAIARGAPLALRAMKEFLRAIDGMSVVEAMAMQHAAPGRLPAYAAMWGSRDSIEGPRAFLERREPRWTGT